MFNQNPWGNSYAQPQHSVKFVDSAEEINSYYVLPNGNQVFFDRNSKSFITKSVDNMGNATIETYSKNNLNQSNNNDNFVTKEDLEKQINELKKLLVKEKSDVNAK